jgi:inner membrane protein
VSSLLLLFVLRKRFKNAFVGSVTSDSIEDEFTGKEALALTDIDPNHGKVELKGAEWNARSPETITAQSWVIIERREGLTLHVRPR